MGMSIGTQMYDTLSTLWARMNPVEPSTGYLVKLMAACLAVMALGWLIGHFWV